MPHMTDRSYVAAQYADDRNLSIRMKLHAKHSTAQISMNDWLFAQYDLMGPCRILELGCGNAAQWEGRLDQLPNGSLLVLSDFSAGMAEIAWKKFESFSNVLVQQIDIQEIPFPDASFDKIIANHMLHHVPNLPQALKEVQRVLRPDGVFYATVIGEGGLQAYLHAAMKGFNPNLDMFGQNLPFSMQNGEEKLRRFFGDVRLIPYEDSLEITETQDLVDWIYSSIDVAGVSVNDLDGVYDYFEAIRVREGAIRIPKEIGMFFFKNRK